MPAGIYGSLIGEAAHQASLYQAQALQQRGVGLSGSHGLQAQQISTYNPYRDSFRIALRDETKTFREELQKETNDWLE